MRKPMVTRTITSSRVQLMCANVETAELFNKTIEVSYAPKENEEAETTEANLLKIAKKMCDNDKEVVVKVVGFDIITQLYGMDENEFIKSAIKLDNETRKPVEA